MQAGQHTDNFHRIEVPESRGLTEARAFHNALGSALHKFRLADGEPSDDIKKQLKQALRCKPWTTKDPRAALILGPVLSPRRDLDLTPRTRLDASSAQGSIADLVSRVGLALGYWGPRISVAGQARRLVEEGALQVVCDGLSAYAAQGLIKIEGMSEDSLSSGNALREGLLSERSSAIIFETIVKPTGEGLQFAMAQELDTKLLLAAHLLKPDIVSLVNCALRKDSDDINWGREILRTLSTPTQDIMFTSNSSVQSLALRVNQQVKSSYHRKEKRTIIERCEIVIEGVLSHLVYVEKDPRDKNNIGVASLYPNGRVQAEKLFKGPKKYRSK